MTTRPDCQAQAQTHSKIDAFWHVRLGPTHPGPEFQRSFGRLVLGCIEVDFHMSTGKYSFCRMLGIYTFCTLLDCSNLRNLAKCNQKM